MAPKKDKEWDYFLWAAETFVLLYLIAIIYMCW